jgi:hypothetical protein
MSIIAKPKNELGCATSIADVLTLLSQWHADNNVIGPDVHRRIWYRGHSNRRYVLAPGVYRPTFTNRAQTIYGRDIEDKCHNLERETLTDFRTSGAALLNRDDLEELYFVAQHHGLSTRLLDWTTNPLAGLFFASCSNDADDGDLFVIDARTVLPRSSSPDSPKGIMSMRHPYAVDAIRSSFWIPPSNSRPPLILPIRPDNLPGRIGQQSSCFTLHMRDSKDCTSATIAAIVIPAKSKSMIMAELRRLNVTQFTVFGTLDHLSREIRTTWEID